MDTKSVKKRNLRKFFQNRKEKLIFLGVALGLIASVFFPTKKGEFIGASLIPGSVIEEEQLGAFPITIPTMRYGFALDTFQVTEDKVQKNQTLGLILSMNGKSVSDIETIIKNCQGVFNLSRDFRQGEKFTILSNLASGIPEHLIFEPNVFEYVVFNLTNEMSVQRVEREVETETRSVDGVIESSLWKTLMAQGINFEAAAKMEDALQWSVDFSHAQAGDEFKMIYEEKLIHGKSVGAGQVFAAYYRSGNNETYSFWFDNGEYKGYYDLDGRTAKKGFLKAPVKFTRISSNYNSRRLHPILKSVRPHLGTDYAAPHGTPIIAVGDGTVIEAAYTSGNGRYVKIKHDGTYQTQYLHMSRFAKGIRKGAHVAQGEVIGYVGSTGLATGPHVCFRFWKDGKQVNHLKLILTKAKPLTDSVLQEFFQTRDKYLVMLKCVESIDNPSQGEATNTPPQPISANP